MGLGEKGAMAATIVRFGMLRADDSEDDIFTDDDGECKKLSLKLSENAAIICACV